MKCLFLPLFLVMTLVGCSTSNGNPAPEKATLVIHSDTTTKAAALNFLRDQHDESDAEGDVFYAEQQWHLDHWEEITNTLSVNDVQEADSLALVLYSYSVGGDIFRDALWMRRYKGRWAVSLDQYFYYSEYNSKDPFGDGNGERAKSMIEKASAWKEGSATIFGY